jgi:multiple sugar transport system permease protein
MSHPVRLRATPYLFILPAFLLMLIILILPVVIVSVLSFTDYGLGNASTSWVGTENYEHIFTHSRYEKMFWATFLYVATVVPISLSLGLGAALLINSLRWGGDLYKTIYFLPVMAALLAMAIVWEFALHPTIGIVNDTLTGFCHVEELRSAWPWFDQSCKDSFPLWFGDKRYALGTICFIGIWQSFGFNMVLYLAGLTSISRELYNAAEMDGAKSAWSRFRLITWPMLGPTTVFVVTISAIRSFQVFDTVEAIFPIGGGPGKSVYVMMFAIYEKGIKQNLIGLGAAITVLFLVFVLLLTLIQHYLVSKKVHYQ